MKKMILIAIMMVAMATSAQAFAPETLTFQGRLTEADGTALPNGNYSVTFRLYTQASGGSPIWSNTRQVALNNGVFSLLLGEDSPLALPFDQLYYVGVQYEADPEMAPRVPLSSTPYSLGVSESAAVTSLNGHTGDFNLVAGSNVSISPSGDDLVISATGSVADNDWTVVGSDMYSAPSGSVGVGTQTPDSKLHVVGDITTGDASNLGTFRTYNSGGILSEFGGDHLGQGGKIELYQEDGSRYMFLEPDFDGDGGFLQVYNGNGGAALQVDGNYGGDTHVSFNGSSSVMFNLDLDGNNAIMLPGDAIGSTEILNEPGIASIIAHGNSSFLVGDAYGPVTSRTITVPESGYILATSSLELELNHQGNSCFVTAGLSTSSNSVPTNQDLSFYLPSSASAGQYLMPSSPTAVFPVDAGTHTIYMVANRVGTTDAVIWDAQLNLLYLPTAYGTVALAEGNDDGKQDENNRTSPAYSAGAQAQERTQSNSDNDRRISDELAELRAQIEALQDQVNRQDNNGGR